MSLLDLTIAIGLLAYVAGLALLSSSAKPRILFISALITAAAAAVSVTAGRNAALIALGVAVVFMLISLWAWYMSGRPRRRPVAAVFTGIMVAAGLFPLFALPARIELPTPTGPYEVGVTDIVVEDSTRGQDWDAVTGKPRRILVRLWYPAQEGEDDAGFEPVMSADERAFKSDIFSGIGLGVFNVFTDALARATTHSRRDVPVADGAFPLIVFSHGYKLPVSSNVTLAEHMASQGYMFASISHPGETVALNYPDGSYEPLNPKANDLYNNFFAESQSMVADYAKNTESMEARAAFLDRYQASAFATTRAPIWGDDFVSVLDGLEARKGTGIVGAIVAHTDFSNVGFAGMSMGALSTPWGCDKDIRCDAFAVLDVPGGPPHLKGAQARTPVLVLEGGTPQRIGGMDFFYEPHGKAGLTESVHRITLPGAVHVDFTDIALAVRPSVRKLFNIGLTGPTPGRALLAAQNEIVGEFFNTYLKNANNEFPDRVLGNHPAAELTDLAAFREWTKEQKINSQSDTQTGAAADQAIDRIADEVWTWRLKSDYGAQVIRGQFIDVITDITLEQVTEDARIAGQFLDAIDAIPVSDLSYERDLTRRFLIERLTDIKAGPENYVYNFAVTPFRAGFELSIFLQYFEQASLESEQARRAYISFINEFADYLTQARDKTLYQAGEGIYLPKPAIPGTVAFFSALRDGAAQLALPAPDRLDGLEAADAERFLSDMQDAIKAKLLPAYDGVIGVFNDDYILQAPDGVGLSQYPGGLDYYRRLIKRYTSYDYAPETLHELGLGEVEQIRAEMAAIRDELAFAGTQQEFHEQLRTDPRFIAKTPEEKEARFNDYLSRIEPLIDDYFSVKPKAPYGVKRLPPENEATQTFGRYQAPTSAEPMGLYLYNGLRLENTSLIYDAGLIYHELIPGHHFHIALQQENDALPAIRNTPSLEMSAFNEGWAEYASSLGHEMGLYDDPYDHYGRLISDVFMASRLVVDTGLNALGWSLEDARVYMRENTFQSDAEIDSELLRYSTDLHGQALAYHLGRMKIWEFRRRAEAALGADFDIRDFHTEVLGPGALPLNVLEAHMDHFIEQDRS